MGLIKIAFLSITVPITIYLGILGLVATFPSLEHHTFYLHRVTLTWFKELNIPEHFGFLHNQVTTFSIPTSDGVTLHAWHVLPLGLYRKHESEILAQPSGFTHDITSRLNFELLRDDPEARLVLYLHGTAGTMASGRRPDNY
jgi:abhydrolase domain-containing protein 12